MSGRRVLIVVSSYAPAMIADMHRARQLAWELPKQGWDVEILVPESGYQTLVSLDADSYGFFCDKTVVHTVRAYGLSWFKRIRVGSIGWRSLVPMLLTGFRLLRKRQFDLVYISTTQFPLFLLGVLWFRCCKVPYILDVHDPIYKDEITPIWATPSFKHKASRKIMKYIEAWSVSSAAGLVSVSPAYLDIFRQRYGGLQPKCLRDGCCASIPFAVHPLDFDVVKQADQTIKYKESLDIIYVGAGGPIMRRSFGLLCQALAYIRDHSPEALQKVAISLLGTHYGWAPGDPCHLADVAANHGVSQWVHEDPSRVTYKNSLARLTGADGALVLGVEDDGYMPSKLFSYAYSGKPLLAVFRRNSPAYAMFIKEPDLGHALWFDEVEDMPLTAAVEVVTTFLREVKQRRIFDRHALLQPYLSSEMASQHAVLFETCRAKSIDKVGTE